MGTILYTTDPNATQDYLTMRLAPRDHEVFTILFLDSRHRLIDVRVLDHLIVAGSDVTSLAELGLI